MKKNKKVPRLPMEAVRFLRSHGGAQGTPKGGRGYDRRREKFNPNKEE